MFKKLDDLDKKFTDKLLGRLKVDTNPKFSPKFRKFIHWIAYDMQKIINKVLSFLILLWIFNKIHSKYGMEKVVIIGFVILIFTLRSLNQKIPEQVEEEKKEKKKKEKEKKPKKKKK